MQRFGAQSLRCRLYGLGCRSGVMAQGFSLGSGLVCADERCVGDMCIVYVYIYTHTRTTYICMPTHVSYICIYRVNKASSCMRMLV